MQCLPGLWTALFNLEERYEQSMDKICFWFIKSYVDFFIIHLTWEMDLISCDPNFACAIHLSPESKTESEEKDSVTVNMQCGHLCVCTYAYQIQFCFSLWSLFKCCWYNIWEYNQQISIETFCWYRHNSYRLQSCSHWNVRWDHKLPFWQWYATGYVVQLRQ